MLQAQTVRSTDTNVRCIERICKLTKQNKRTSLQNIYSHYDSFWNFMVAFYIQLNDGDQTIFYYATMFPIQQKTKQKTNFPANNGDESNKEQPK